MVASHDKVDNLIARVDWAKVSRVELAVLLDRSRHLLALSTVRRKWLACWIVSTLAAVTMSFVSSSTDQALQEWHCPTNVLWALLVALACWAGSEVSRLQRITSSERAWTLELMNDIAKEHPVAS